MSCRPFRMKDGTVILVDVKPGETLTDEEAKILEQYLQFCRDRRAKRKVKDQRRKRESQKPAEGAAQ